MASNRLRGSTFGIEMFASQAAWIAMTLLQSSEGELWPSLARLLAPDCTNACHLVKGSARRRWEFACEVKRIPRWAERYC